MDHLNRLYFILAGLARGTGGPLALRECNGRMEWPRRGVYFFFEPGENRPGDDSEPRVVRVGTHAVSRGSKTTLWKRLRNHRGTRAGTGNHRSSIFRGHVGGALLERHAELACATWRVGKSAPKEIREAEKPIERRVSEHIGRMRFLWIAVGDSPGPTSDRAYIERNCISLLAERGRLLDPPSADWLGHDCPAGEIRGSGLWNVNHVSDRFDPASLDVLDEYARVTTGRSSPPEGPLAPHGWWEE